MNENIYFVCISEIVRKIISDQCLFCSANKNKILSHMQHNIFRTGKINYVY